MFKLKTTLKTYGLNFYNWVKIIQNKLVSSFYDKQVKNFTQYDLYRAYYFI